jgi:glycosyltransferase involved in cell wall biosynthesis
MAISRILTRTAELWRQFPAARTHLRQHGLRLTILRIVETVLRGPQQRSVTASSRWLRNGETGQPPMVTDARGLGRPAVAIIGALDLPQCKKYRILQKIEALEIHGCATTISNYFDVPRSFDALQLATLVVLYRVPDGELLQAYLQEARRLGLPVAYDIDDPVFCRTVYAANANLQTLSAAERQHLLNDSRRYLAALKQCDAAIVSTPGMVEVTRPYLDGKPVYLWRNAVDAESRSICDDITSMPAAPEPHGRIRIGYMSGSRAHDLDFELIGPALARTLAAHPHVDLVLSGHVSIPEALKPHAARIQVRPLSSYRGYFQVLSQVDIVVIPLLADTFNACKSAIRFLEAAMLERACVVSGVGDFLNIVDHGRTGYVALSEDDWSNQLDMLIESADRRRALGQAARQDVLESQTTQSISAGLDPALLATIRGHAGG